MRLPRQHATSQPEAHGRDHLVQRFQGCVEGLHLSSIHAAQKVGLSRRLPARRASSSRQRLPLSAASQPQLLTLQLALLGSGCLALAWGTQWCMADGRKWRQETIHLHLRRRLWQRLGPLLLGWRRRQLGQEGGAGAVGSIVLCGGGWWGVGCGWRRREAGTYVLMGLPAWPPGGGIVSGVHSRTVCVWWLWVLQMGFECAGRQAGSGTLTHTPPCVPALLSGAARPRSQFRMLPASTWPCARAAQGCRRCT